MHRTLLLAIALVFTAPALAQDRAPRLAPGPVAVKVTGAGKPLPAAIVHLGERYAGTGADGVATLEGVPAGTYDLVVAERGYDRVERSVTLPAGARDAIEVALTEAPRVALAGRVIVEDDKRAIPGARITLEPVRVAGAIQGRIEGGTDWSGAFQFAEVPAGAWRAEVRAPGCKARAFEVEAAPGMAAVDLALIRETTAAALRAVVKDAASGAGIPGAKVVLAEAYPLGKIAEATSGAGGEVALAGLRVGQLNWADASGGLAVSRRVATLRAEAAGYAPGLVPVTLEADGRAEVALARLEKVVEREPNDTLETAQRVVPGTPIELAFATPQDADWFRFRLAHRAMVRVELPAAAAERHIILKHADGRAIREHGAHPNAPARIEMGLQPGEYLVVATEWGQNAAMPAPILLTIDAAGAPDALEPNDGEGGRLLRAGEEVRGCFLPWGDVDRFRFDMPRPGSVRVQIAPVNLERWVGVKNEAGRVVAERGTHPNAPLDLVAGLPAGRYTLEVREWGDNAESLEPYALRFDVIEDDGLEDAPPRTLQPGTLAGGTINPWGDADRFAVPLPSAGKLRIFGAFPGELYVRILDPKGAPVAERGGSPPSRIEAAWHAPGPCTAIVEVTEWGSNDWSPHAYTLEAVFEPADELEALGRNDTADLATPAEPGDVLRGSLVPWGDGDFFRLDLDHPGWLDVAGRGPGELYARIRDRSGKPLAERGAYPGQALQFDADLPAGPCFVEVREWGDNDTHCGDYALRARLVRAEPEERADLKLADDPVRPLRAGEARSFSFDQYGDRDRFALDLAAAGKVTFRVHSAGETYLVVFDDRDGKPILERGFYAGVHEVPIEAKGPARWRLELREWGDNARSPGPSHILADLQGRELPLEKVDAAVDPVQPVLVTFKRSAVQWVAAVARVQVDADGDGRADLDVPAGGATFRYANEGVYPATAILEGANGVRTLSRFWVEAIGPRERKGVRVLIDSPAEGQVVERDAPCRVRAASYTGARMASVTVLVDGRPAGAAYQSPYAVSVPWRALAAGKHTLEAVAVDARGERASATRTVERSEYFDLLPEEGAVVTGNDVRVTWSGTAFGPAKVRWRAKGTESWTEVVGESARDRAVVLTGLEAGKPYEVQPIGAGEPGPSRTVTRVKGLAFGRSRYGGTVARDYDQRLGVSVRNHGEEPRVVRLECGAPPEGSKLLVGFVGEGSDRRPFTLGPGEERDFLLGISAQDVITERHEFPIRLASESGAFTDEAEVEVEVKLPVVKLAWESLGAAPGGALAQRFRVVNQGDALTDLDLSASNDKMLISPSIQHGLFPAGAAKEVLVYPKLHEGFTGAETTLAAKAVASKSEQPVKVQLPEGKRIYPVVLAPEPGSTEEAQILKARVLAGAYLNPRYVKWERGQTRFDDKLEGILWEGEDHDGDGMVDFVRADIGSDGQVEYAAFRAKDGTYEETNLAEAYLEMGYKLPWARNAYEKHDVDIVFNGQVVSSRKDDIPEGSYTVRIPPSLIRFGPTGVAEGNEVDVRSTHLKGGHYVVGSDFALKLRLTGTRVYSAGASAEEAAKTARATEGLSMEGPDFAVSSGEMKIEGDLRKGGDAVISVPVRNLGATRVRSVDVALVRAVPGGAGVEIARQTVEDLGLTGEKVVRFPWKAAAGTHALQVVVDPDRKLPDASRENDTALLPVTIPGDDAKPELKILDLADGQTIKDTVLPLSAEAIDDAGLSKLEARIDNGLWTEIPKKGAKLLLQPGEHVVTVRATDGSGNQVEQTIKGLKVDAPLPKGAIASPAEGAQIKDRKAEVVVDTGDDTKLAAVRANGGPWRKAKVEGGKAKATVLVSYGPQKIEAMTVNNRGAVRICGSSLFCGQQPDPEIAPLELPPIGLDDGVIDIEGIGAVDMFQPPTRVVPPKVTGLRSEVSSVNPTSEIGGTSGGRYEGPPPVRPAGGYVAVQKKCSDWYCTNRPQIKVPFQLPGWVLKKNLPKPGTHEFEVAVIEMLEQLKARGIDTTAFERFQQKLIERIRRLEGPDQLPTFLESIGLSRPKPTDPDELRKWRQQMEDAANAWWLRLLASGDPQLIYEGLKARGEAIGKFDQGVQDAAEAVIETIAANQKLAEQVLEALPVVGDAVDILSIIRGETLSGEKMTALGYLFSTLGVVGPAALGKLLERPGVRDALGALAEKGSALSREAREILAGKLGIDPAKLEKSYEAIIKTLTKERSLFKETAEQAIEREAAKFAKSAEGIEDAARQAADRARASKTIDELAAAKNADEFHDAVIKMQKDKTAQALINGKDVPDELRKKVKNYIDDIYKQTDGDVIKKLEQSDYVKKLAEKNGIDPKDVNVEVLTITNVRKKKPGEVEVTSVGRDRDVTYTVYGKDPKTGRKIKLDDVDHNVSKPIYEAEIWKKTRKDPLPADPAAISKHADELDQAVTSRWHPEAYNPGEVKLNDFLDKSKQPTLTRPEDIADTVRYKSDHWFEKAGRAGDPVQAAKDTAEGMRQATKQYNDLVLSRVEQYRQIVDVHVPPKLQAGMDVFKKVQDGVLTPKQAEEVLKNALGTSKEQVVAGLAAYVEGLEKGAGRAFREVKTVELAKNLQSLPRDAGGLETGMNVINEALARGNISGETFNALRNDFWNTVYKKAQGSLPADRNRLRNAVKEAVARRVISKAEESAALAQIPE